MKTKLIITALAFLIVQLTFGQIEITGKTENYNGKANDILVNPFFPESIGEINTAGAFTLAVDEGYFERLKKQMEEASKNSQNAMSLSTLKKFQTRYQCEDDAFSFINGDQPYIELLSNIGLIVGDLETKNITGLIRVVSSKEFGDSQTFNPQKDPATGFMLDWYYVEKQAEIKGNCTTQMSTGNGDETYKREIDINLDLHPGWNLVKYEIAKVYTANDGKQYTQTMKYSTLESFPKNVKYIYIEKQ